MECKIIVLQGSFALDGEVDFFDDTSLEQISGVCTDCGKVKVSWNKCLCMVMRNSRIKRNINVKIVLRLCGEAS